MGRLPSAVPPQDHKETLEMKVANMTFMVDRLGKDCAPLQFVRELTQNAIESIQKVPAKSGEIHWDVDWNRHTLTNTYKLSIIDNGIGMTGEEMVKYINNLSSSMHEQSAQGNFGIGAKIAAAPRNHAGLVYLSWKDGVGHMIHLWRDPDTNVYGLRRFERPDGTSEYWAYVQDDIKPELIKDHGTMVILLGNSDQENTVQAPPGAAMPSRWVLRYLNTRYARFPKGIEVKAREGWELPRADKRHNFLRAVSGQMPWLQENSVSHGEVRLTSATAHWYIIKGDIDQDSGHLAGGGHIAALYKDELYDMATGRMGVSRLQGFGVIFGHSRVVMYVEPIYDSELFPNSARTSLLIDGEPLPWADWAAEFRERMPKEIMELMEEVGAASVATDHRQAILDRLKQIRDLFRFSRYRPTKNGSLNLDPESIAPGGEPEETSGKKKGRSGSSSGNNGGRAGDIYALFLAARGVPGEEFQHAPDPDTKWITVEDGTRTAPDLEDKAAKYLPQQNLLLINGDFRVFRDMIERWCKLYAHVSGAKTTIEQVVREWFEQQLVEAVLGAMALRGSPQWTLVDTEKMWSEEALTAVVLPRYHIDISVKRALGAKLGTLKERAST